MKLIIKLLLNALAVVALSKLLSGVNVDTYTTAIIVAVVLSILNVLVKPILIVLTLPITILTLGLFLLIVNAIIIILADKLIDGFTVNGIWTAALFSILLSVLQSILHSLLKDEKRTKNQ
ncbi:phage holin family protein [Winogradskyella haliclonae]|nr:phage holin family protein [Winogradskyella haliclonae]